MVNGQWLMDNLQFSFDRARCLTEQALVRVRYDRVRGAVAVAVADGRFGAANAPQFRRRIQAGTAKERWNDNDGKTRTMNPGEEAAPTVYPAGAGGPRKRASHAGRQWTGKPRNLPKLWPFSYPGSLNDRKRR